MTSIEALYEDALVKIERLRTVNAALLEALEEIARREGPFKMDRLEHAHSCIENMGSIADRAIALAKGEKP